jgi:hypothetical protein
VEKLKPKTTHQEKVVPVAQSYRDRGDPVPISERENGENLPCGFWGLSYSEEKSVFGRRVDYK